ncbi:hypothetical protein STANM309S_06270 [Streptomyces tanashiensis]
MRPIWRYQALSQSSVSKGSGSATCSWTGSSSTEALGARSEVPCRSSSPLPVVAEGEGLGDGGAEREPGVHAKPSLGVRRGGQHGPLQQLLAADPVLMGHALLDRVEGGALEEVRVHTWCPASRSRSAACRTAGLGPRVE